MSLRRVFIYLLRPRWHRKSFRTATRYPAPTTPEQPDFAHGKFLVFCNLQPTKSACSAATGNGLSGVGQPLSSVSGRKRYNTLDFPTENRVPSGTPSPLDTPAKGNAVSLWIPYANRDAARPYWKPRAKRIFPSGHPACPCSSDPSCFYTIDTLLPEQVKQAQRFAQIAGKSLCLFWSAAAGKGERKALLTDKFELEIFALRCENLLL